MQQTSRPAAQVIKDSEVEWWYVDVECPCCKERHGGEAPTLPMANTLARVMEIAPYCHACLEWLDNEDEWVAVLEATE